MKRYNYKSRAVLILIILWLLVGGYTANQAMASDSQSRRGDVAGSASITITRIPNLGGNVVVNVYVDGALFAIFGYGHTFKGFLAPGRHVLSVHATPDASWFTWWETTLDVRSGQSYNFTAMGDSSGSLFLKRR